ncbi:MAG: hypothetical protein AAFR40_18070 [Pseudomonadota bacterium]
MQGIGAAALLALTAGVASAAPLQVVEITEIISAGDPTPSGAGFFSADDIAVDDQGRVATQVDSGAPGGVDQVIRFDGGTQTVVAEDGQALPGLSIVPTGFDDHFEIRNGLVAFNARFASSDNDAILIGDGTATRVVAQAGVTPLPFGPGTATSYSLSDAEGFGFDGTRTAFVANRINDTFGNAGVYVEDGSGNIARILDSTEAPLSPLTGTAYTSFNDAMADANGPGIVFVADVDNGTFGGGERALMLFDGSTLSVIDVVSNNNELLEPDIDGGMIAYQTRVGGIDRLNLFDGFVLTTLLSAGDMLFGEEVTFIGASGVAIADGVVAFLAETATSGLGIFLWHDGAFTEVVRNGGQFDGQTVNGLSFQNRPYLADGFLAFEMEGASTGTTIYRVAFAEGAEVPLPPAGLALLAALGGLALLRRRR